MPQLPMENMHRFSHEAMATVYEIWIHHEDAGYARGAATEAFRVLDQLEQDLSSYIENSDISQLNALDVGESTVVGLDTFTCLRQCMQLYMITSGVFDITIGALLDVWLDDEKELLQPDADAIRRAVERTGLHNIELDAERFVVKMVGGPVSLDLGGFGKGYAVDKMSETLTDWEAPRHFIHGGASSVLAAEAPENSPGWPITLTNPFTQEVLEKRSLLNKTLGSSGLQKGRHIIDPRTAKPLRRARATWSTAPTAAFSDGLSTAFMLLSIDEIRQLIADFPEFGALLVFENSSENDESVVRVNF